MLCTGIVKAIEMVAGGATYDSAGIGQPSRMPGPLTGRELEVLKRVARGRSSKQIAQELELDCRTVDSHRRNIMRKLDTENAAEMITNAYRLGLIDFMV